MISDSLMQKESIYKELRDNELWRMLMGGDIDAGEVLYVRYYDLLYNYGMKYCRDEEFIKDCIQELFVKIYLHPYRSDVEYVRSYLLKSMTHIIFDRYRSVKRVIPLTDLTFDVFEDVSDEMDESIMSDDDLLMFYKLKHAQTELTDKQKRIIYLRFVQRLSYKEIAAVLDINVQSAMNSVHRAVCKLRKCMSRF